MLRSYRTRITREGWVLLALLTILLGAAINRDINLLIALCGMLMGVLLLNWRWAVANLRALELQRKLPPTAIAGEPFDVEWQLRNPRRRRVWMVQLADVARLDAATRTTEKTTILFPVIAARDKGAERYRACLPHRGIYEFGPALASTSFPLGLIRRSALAPDVARLTVYPRLGTLSSHWRGRFQEADIGSRKAQRWQGLTAGDFHGLRDWRSGDSSRLIHWRTSAKQQSLMVRQFERHRNQELVLVLDLWQPSGAADSAALELAISFVATLASEICRRGGNQLVVSVAARQSRVLRGPASPAFLHEVLELLALSQPTARDVLAGSMQESLEVARADANIVVASTRPLDLDDSHRLGDIWERVTGKNLRARTMVVDVTDAQFPDLFTFDAATASTSTVPSNAIASHAVHAAQPLSSHQISTP
jgi:uncharacterized protein (DUF58 family)